VIALVGFGEEARMATASRGWEARHVENGAQMFDQYCANCHGPNASGGICPPLDATSGLHGGQLGPGIAWRLEDIGWDRSQAYAYIYSVIASGRTISTRPERYPGNRVPAAPPGPGTPAPEATDVLPMAMPAWSQDFGGPLRPDQIQDLASYVAAFAEAIPATPEVARATADAYRGAGAGGAGEAGTGAGAGVATEAATEAADESPTPRPSPTATP
jgi:mono/diheme cytochrome c family protein